DSARLRNDIAKRVNVDQNSLGAYMLGEHGISQFAYWSNVNIAGNPLDQLAQDYPQRFALDKDETEQDARR
ncbi:L-lactate dehydrogenase, partial [Bifidobacterium pseudocatenulatum]|nr:L-lactate dehydrogenase [Bifidobacterium pseudocatenulatum]